MKKETPVSVSDTDEIAFRPLKLLFGPRPEKISSSGKICHFVRGRKNTNISISVKYDQVCICAYGTSRRGSYDMKCGHPLPLAPAANELMVYFALLANSRASTLS